MNRTQLELEPGLILDARRAVWLSMERVLVVADLHLGYAWTHRQSGQLLPLAVEDDVLRRLRLLVQEYAPAQLVVLGDIVHGECEMEPIRAQIRELVEDIGALTELRMIEGNHDFALRTLLPRVAPGRTMALQMECGPHLLLHGHELGGGDPAQLFRAAHERRGRVIFGHEHPAVRLSDGVATSARCHCFVAGEGGLILPSFTHYSPGGGGRFGMFSQPGIALVPQAKYAVLAGKLLRLPADWS